jgi:hypothetical protein
MPFNRLLRRDRMARAEEGVVKTKSGAATPRPVIILFSQAEPADDLLVSRSVFPGEILQQLISPADELEQSTPRGVILFMRVEMSPKVIDAFGDERDLHFGRPGVLLVDLVIFDNILFLLGRYRHRKLRDAVLKPLPPRPCGVVGSSARIKGGEAKVKTTV